jgi:hypothetical protein
MNPMSLFLNLALSRTDIYIRIIFYKKEHRLGFHSVGLVVITKS